MPFSYGHSRLSPKDILIVPPPGTECCLRKQVSGLLESQGTPGKIPA